MALQHDETAPETGVRKLTREEGIAFFDEMARRYTGMSGEEFLRRWDAGESTRMTRAACALSW